jgi:hypothetical protein
MRIRRSKHIDPHGLKRLSRQYTIAPFFIDQLKRGEVIELSDDKAQLLIDNGYALKAGGRPPVNQVTVDDRDVETTETVGDSLTDDGEDEYRIDDKSHVEL